VNFARFSGPRHSQLLHADDEVSNHLIDDAQPPIDFLHQLARAGDGLDDVVAFTVMTDVVGEALAPPVLSLVQRPVVALDDLLDLRVQIGNLLLAGLGRDDVDELVLSCCAHVSPYGLPPSLGSAELRRDKG
jgi:hypothetical protein